MVANVVLFEFIKQGSVAGLQQSSGFPAVPIRVGKGIGNDLAFCFANRFSTNLLERE